MKRFALCVDMGDGTHLTSTIELPATGLGTPGETEVLLIHKDDFRELVALVNEMCEEVFSPSLRLG